MVQQTRKVALLVYLNIAAGCSRPTERFLEIARESVIKIDAAIGIAYKLRYDGMKYHRGLGNWIVSCFKQLQH